MPYADVNGRRLHYIRRGEGEPLLLIMGLSGNHLHWGEPFLEQLEGDFDVIAHDNRGIGRSDHHGGPFSVVDMADDAVGLLDAVGLESAHVMGISIGRSAPVREPFSIADLADDAAGLLDALGWDTAHVMGISMGGMIAQEVALRHPERVRSLVLGCTYAGGEGSALTAEAVIMRLTQRFMSGDVDAALRAGWEVNVSRAYRDEHPEAAERMLQIAAELPGTIEILLAQVQAVAGHNTSARLGEIKAPTLIVHGTEDQMLGVANARQIAGLMPDARLEILDGVGHLFFWEQPERAAELVREHTAVAARQ
jgi:pimeloyl-ACP methyl ester carboxylesterase